MASEEDLRRERELEQIMQRRAGINTKIVDDLQDMSNVLNNRVQLLQFQKAEKTQIRSLTREVNKIASENYNITAGELGLTKKYI
jgi:RNA polymerase-binding transcription factor DksA